ncbi:hypothetical protein ACQEU6_01755 [Spirillospora sp. CA-108201]
MTRLQRADEALGVLLRWLAVTVVVACALGLLASVALIMAGLLRTSPAVTLGAAALIASLYALARLPGRGRSLPPEWYGNKCRACAHSQAAHKDGSFRCSEEVAPFRTEVIIWFDNERIEAEHGTPCGCPAFQPGAYRDARPSG